MLEKHSQNTNKASFYNLTIKKIMVAFRTRPALETRTSVTRTALMAESRMKE